MVAAIENNYSFIAPGMPNYGIAQGSIFVIFGSGLSTAYSGLQSLPLKAMVDGVSVQFSVGGSTTQALLYYVSPNQVAGVMPSATPVGTGTVMVTVNGAPGTPAPLTVVQSAFGIAANSLPLNAAVFEVSRGYWTPLSPTNAANPGEFIEFYGTGGGPNSGDETGQQKDQNLTNVPIEVDIGGVAATVAYHGRSTWPGLDQIDVMVPAGVSGCQVSLVVVSSGLVSNFAFLPIAAQGRTCSDQVPGVTPPAQVSATGTSFATAQLSILRTVDVTPQITLPWGGVVPAGNTTTEAAGGSFERITLPSSGTIGIGPSGVSPSLGSCRVAVLPALSITPLRELSSSPPYSNLNAGPALDLTGPNGESTLASESAGFYSGTLSGAGNTPFLPAAGGTITIDNAGGGSDVPAFTTQIQLQPPLVWSNITSLAPMIDRSIPLTVKWTGGNPHGVATIVARSPANTPAGQVDVQVICNAPISAGQFTIPASALLELPPGLVLAEGSEAATAGLEVSSIDTYPFSATGLDLSVIVVDVVNTLTVGYQ